MIGRKLQALGPRQRIDRLEVADPARRVAPPEVRIELGVARGRVIPVEPERPVNGELTTRREDPTDAAEECLYLVPGHDVQRVRAVYRVGRADRPGRQVYVKLDRRPQIRCALESRTLAEPVKPFATLRRLPSKVREMSREIHRVLTGARAHLEHKTPRRENVLQDREDRPLVALAGVRTR